MTIILNVLGPPMKNIIIDDLNIAPIITKEISGVR